MKKTALFLVLILTLSILTLASCSLFGKKECTEHVDADGNFICDKCQAELEKTDTPSGEQPDDGSDDKEEPTPECEHADADKDHKCDACGETISECAAAEGSHNCAI